MAGMYPDNQTLELFGEAVSWPGVDEKGKFTSGSFSDPAVKPSFIPAETISLILNNLSELLVWLGKTPNNHSADQLALAFEEFVKGGKDSPKIEAGVLAENAVETGNLEENERTAWLPATKTIDTDMANLQSVIDSLPRYLRRNVTIRVKSGTVTDNITIERFCGPGSLDINNGSLLNNPNTQTHKCAKIICQQNNVGRLSITGFTATATTGYGFSFIDNACFISVNYCKATEGNSSMPSNSGVYVSQCLSVAISSCTFSNKTTATYVQRGVLLVNSAYGSGNGIVFLAQSLGTRRIYGTSITGTTLYTCVGGGVVSDSSGKPQLGNPLAVAPNISYESATDYPVGTYLLAGAWASENIARNSPVTVASYSLTYHGPVSCSFHIEPNEVSYTTHLAGTWRVSGEVTVVSPHSTGGYTANYKTVLIRRTA